MSHSSDDDLPLAQLAHLTPLQETQQTQEAEDEDVAGPSAPTKRYRPSKKEIPDYPFSEDQHEEVANFVLQHPVLFDKTHPEWPLRHVKENLWKLLAPRFPNCTWLQVRKFFEAKRTAFGKIEKREAGRSGAPPPRARTFRENKICRIWGFLGGHIVHEATVQSQRFTPPDDAPAAAAAAATQEFEGGDDGNEGNHSSSSGGHSAHSIERRRQAKKQRNESVLSERVNVSQDGEQQTLAGHAIKELLDTAKEIQGKRPQTGFALDVQRFLAFLERKIMRTSPVNFSLLSSKMLEMVSLLEEPPEGTTAIPNARALLAPYVQPPAPPAPAPSWQPQPGPSHAPPVYYPPPPPQQYQWQQAPPQPQPPLQPPPPPPPTPTPQHQYPFPTLSPISMSSPIRTPGEGIGDRSTIATPTKRTYTSMRTPEKRK